MNKFEKFDELAGYIWKKPIKELSQRIKNAHIQDTVARSGISLVFGCPLPTNIQQNILEFQHTINEHFSNILFAPEIKWRQDVSAYHITVYGLVKPAEYIHEISWQTITHVDMLKKIRTIVSSHLECHLVLQGIGILGSGGIAIRITDNKKLTKIRNTLVKIQEISPQTGGETVNKIIIGRLLPDISGQRLHMLKSAIERFKNYMIGELSVHQLNLVHYKHEFLDSVYEQRPFP